MPTVKNEEGEVISRQPYTPEGESRAEDIASSNLNWEVDYAPGGTADGSMRSVQEYAGGGKVGYDSIGMYDKGGKTEAGGRKKAQKMAGWAKEEKHMTKEEKKAMSSQPEGYMWKGKPVSYEEFKKLKEEKKKKKK